MFFSKLISNDPKYIHEFTLRNWTPTKKLVFSALMAALATILQSAGGYLPGIGFFISPFTTMPILLAILISLRYGIFTYLLAIFLMLLIEPSELFIFPFTTGILGVGLGLGLRLFRQRIGIILINGCLLFVGICIPLYLLQFPVFGPMTSSSFNFSILLAIFGFSIFYSWLWLGFSLLFLRKIKNVLLR